jgi:hypothetical protein
MVLAVVTCCKQLKILDAIVRFVAVNVVDVHSVWDAAIMFLPNIAVHGDTSIFSVICLIVPIWLEVEAYPVSLLNRVDTRPG